MSNLISLESESVLEKLQGGETVICEECGKGRYLPFNQNYHKNRWFRCDNCGSTLHFEPNITIE